MPVAPSRAPKDTVLSAWPVLLVRAAHPVHAVVAAVLMGSAATFSGRPGREALLVAATVLVGQVVIGWHNDVVDRARDAAHDRPGKPVAAGTLDAGSVWFAIACGVLLLVPLSLGSGVTAGVCYLLSVGCALLGNVVLRRSAFSWVPWAASYALLAAYLSYGGWGGQAQGDPPTVVTTVLAAVLGACVHVLLALPDLVPDNEDGLRHLPLRLALRLGARRLLWLSLAATAVTVAGLLVAGLTVGLRQ